MHTYTSMAGFSFRTENGRLLVNDDNLPSVDGRSLGGRNEAINDVFHGMVPLHHRIANLHIGGMSNAEIARFLQITEEGVHDILAKEYVNKYILMSTAVVAADMTKVVGLAKARMAEVADEAADFEIELLRRMRDRMSDIKAASLGFSVSEAILNRVGAKEAQKIDIRAQHTHTLTAEVAAEVMDVIRESDAIDITDQQRYIHEPAKISEISDSSDDSSADSSEGS